MKLQQGNVDGAAAKLAGLKEVPVIIRNYSSQEIVEISLIENIQREDLNPIEEAQAYKRLLTEFNLKQDEVAGKSIKEQNCCNEQYETAEAVRWCTADDYRRYVVNRTCKSVDSIEDPELQLQLAQRIFDEKLSVREVEKLVKVY